jgi:hypothetical protein
MVDRNLFSLTPAASAALSRPKMKRGSVPIFPDGLGSRLRCFFASPMCPSLRLRDETNRFAGERFSLGAPHRLALPVEAGSRVSVRDVDPVLAYKDPLAALEAAVLRPIDKGAGDPVVDHAPLHLKAGDDFRFRFLEEGNDVRRRVASRQKSSVNNPESPDF